MQNRNGTKEAEKFHIKSTYSQLFITANFIVQNLAKISPTGRVQPRGRGYSSQVNTIRSPATKVPQPHSYRGQKDEPRKIHVLHFCEHETIVFNLLNLWNVATFLVVYQNTKRFVPFSFSSFSLREIKFLRTKNTTTRTRPSRSRTSQTVRTYDCFKFIKNAKRIPRTGSKMLFVRYSQSPKCVPFKESKPGRSADEMLQQHNNVDRHLE